MSHVIVLAGGVPHAHDFTATGEALATLFRSSGHDVDVVDHPDLAASQLTQSTDALVVCALFWTMTGDMYDAWRPQWAYATSTDTRRRFSGFVREGGGLLAIHTASICFDDWAEWGDIVGGAWRWGVSWHPEFGAVRSNVVARHDVVRGVEASFEIADEVYGDLELRPGIEVLATARRTHDDADQPVLWAQQYGSGRVVYDGFGHDASSITDAVNARILNQALKWVKRGD